MGDEDVQAADGVITPTAGLLCEECGDALPPPKRKTKNPRRFCSGRCRVAWHKRQHDEQIEKVRAQLQDGLDVLNAMPKGKRHKKNRAPGE
jgi:hypothetical protein